MGSKGELVTVEGIDEKTFAFLVRLTFAVCLDVVPVASSDAKLYDDAKEEESKVATEEYVSLPGVDGRDAIQVLGEEGDDDVRQNARVHPRCIDRIAK